MRRRIRVLACLLVGMLVASTAHAEPLEGDYLYRFSTVRAAPGSLADLLDWLEALESSGYYDDSGEPHPFVMRHSQGDHWDLLIVTPMGSFTAFYEADAAEQRQRAAANHAATIAPVESYIAFHEDLFALGPPLDSFSAAWAESDFFHVEMFEALPGKSGELFEQRRMENAYLVATGQVPNMVFRRAAGSDVDVFTVGFHASFESFATPASASDEERETAAKDSGFKDRADISYYLRSLIAGHHDTLAVKVD